MVFNAGHQAEVRHPQTDLCAATKLRPIFSIKREIQSVRVLKQPSCSEHELVLKLLTTLGMKVAACENTRSAMM